ncbi:MAG: ribonuclease H-like YkuK family protein [Alcaligenaceae bacterium]
MRNIDVNEVRAFIEAQGPATKIYIGCDSERFAIGKDWYADYTLAVVVHINGNNGCKLFGEVQRERDWDQKQDRPRMRLMNEVYKIADLFQKLKDVLEGRELEVHLDINPDEVYGSSCVVNEAIGYIRGMCNVIPMVKPNAFAATNAADRLKFVLAKAA